MKRLLFFVFSAMCLVLLSGCSGGGEEEASSELGLFATDGAAVKSVTLAAVSSDYSFRIITNESWSLSTDVAWVKSSSASGHSGAAQVTLSIEVNEADAARTAVITVRAGSLSKTLRVNQLAANAAPDENPDYPKADLLDVSFRNDGTAYDVSANGLKVTPVSGATMVNYYSKTYSRYIAHFNHGLGEAAGDGYYKVDYSSDPEMIAGLADGHSIEVVFKIGRKSDGSSEVKMFSAMNQGGTGIMVSKASKGTQLTFLPNVSSTGSSNWIWTQSGINPEPDRYYHVVGVWDKSKGKSCIYVDGVLKGTANASGSFIGPATSGTEWFGIGADAGTSAGEAAWNGDVVIARVYNDPLSAEQVSALYSAVKKDQSVSTLDISDISFLSPCELKAGYKFYVYASGLKSGDVLRLESLSSESSAFDCVTDSGNGFLRLTVPSAIASGNYRIMLERGSYGYPLGTVKVAVSDHPVNVGSTRVVAHRGYHVDGGASENSIAALAGAQKIGAYACEFDTWITTDGVVVINHNANVGSDARKIQYSTYSELKDLTLSNGEKLPTLKSYLEQGKKGDVKLMLEIKTHASREDNNRVVDSCLAAVSRAGLDDKMIYIAFDYENCKRIVSKRPAAIVQYLGGNKTPAEVAADGLKGIGYSYSVLSSRPEWITGARQLGILVDVWTVNNSQMMLDYISKGVDLITTDYPTTLQDLLGRTYVTAPD